ncbi:MAG: transposase [Bradymonadia bacterium]
MVGRVGRVVLSLPASVRIYLFAEATDMRRGFDGLSALVLASGLDVFSGHVFAFVSRRGDRAKVLTWQLGGVVLWYTRLKKPVSSA